MQQEQRTISFDNELQIEAYQFIGLMQKFPNHFHEYYVIGYVESGRRALTCKNKEYIINSGDLVIFNPLENHACAQVDERALDWRCFHIKTEIMKKTAAEITGSSRPPHFSVNVIPGSDIVARIKELHQMIREGRTDFEKEERFYFLIEELIANYAEPETRQQEAVSTEIQRACDYMDTHFTDTITLESLSDITGLKKYTLLRHFTKQRGITPYRYLETVRVSEAKRLLEQGMSPLDAALQTGFTDQSHFSRFFKNFIGLTPKQYQDIFK